MNAKLLSLGLLTASILFINSGQANATPYTFTDLGTIGGKLSQAFAVNNDGQVVGLSYITGDSYFHATMWSGNTITDLGTLGGAGSAAYAINSIGQAAGVSNTISSGNHTTLWNGTAATDLGVLGLNDTRGYAINGDSQVAGTAYIGSGIYHATVWNGTAATDLGTLGGDQSQALGMNNIGQVVGFSDALKSSNHATLWNGTTATELDGYDSIAYAINDSSQIVGYALYVTSPDIYGFTQHEHATLWDGINTTDLGTLGGSWSHARAINNSGVVVGNSVTTDDTAIHAALWNGTNIFDLNSYLDANTVSAGWVLEYAYGINDNGWIVGNASNRLLGIGQHAFLLAPVPEPETYSMMFVGLGLIGFMMRRRKCNQVL